MGVGANAPGRKWAAAEGAGRAVARLIAAQRDRWILWLPAAAVAGAALWLLAPEDPPRWAGGYALLGAALAAALVASLPTRERSPAWEAARAVAVGSFAFVAFVALGAAAAEVRTAIAASPRLAAETAPVIVEGWVDEVEAGSPRTRLRLLVHRIEGITDAPLYVRVTTPGVRAFTAGRAIRCRAVLRPPDGPIAPGAYDFARRAYFEQLGGSGFTLGRCRPIILPAPDDVLQRIALWLGAVRADMADVIYAASPGPGGAVAASIVVGDRSRIDEETNQALFNSGLGHILSVSGLHMSIAGGVAYGALAALFSLVPFIALRVSVPKLAAGGALLALTFYLFLSGASVPAQRSFLMAAVALGAKLIDRPAISMRGLALAALLIVLWLPESVLEPGFQTSFAATAALVAAFEAWDRARKSAPHLPTPGPLVGALQGIGRGIGGALLVSFVAGLATDPFALYHFQRFSVYGLPANLAVAPLVSFVMAPAAALAAILAPFGLAELPLQVLAAACDLMVRIGFAFAERPEALTAVPKPPDGAFLLAAFAITWACLWRGGARWLAAPMLAGALGLYALAPRPVLLFDGELRAVLTRTPSGAWALLRPYGRSTFARDRLGAMAGLTPDVLDQLAPPEGCSEAACAWTLPGGTRTAFIADASLAGDGNLAGAGVFSRGDVDRADAAFVIDGDSLERLGGGAIYETANGPVIRRARSDVRPWSGRGDADEDDGL